MRYGIDWISIRQKHPGATQHASELVCRFDLETGQAIESARSYRHKGSFDESVTVRSYGGWVEWSGNPARWGRADNVAAISMVEAIGIINRHMESLGLPQFTAKNGQESELVYQDGTRADEFLGAILTRVDLCRTGMTGCPASSTTFMRAMAVATYRGKPPKDYNGEGVAWGGLPNIYFKWYPKGPEIRANTPKGLYIHRQYRRALADWCEANGVVRWEVSLGRNALRRYGLRMLCDWNQEQAETIAERIRGDMKVGATVTIDNTEAAFKASGFSDIRSRTAAGLVSRWYQGQDVWSSFGTQLNGKPKQSAYNYRNWILDIVGIDIRSKPNIAVLTTRIREVELAPLQLPSWYRYDQQAAA